RREHEMLDAVVPAALEHRERARHVAVRIRERRLDAVADARLRREMHDAVEALVREEIRHGFPIGEIDLHELEVRGRLELREPRTLQRDVVVLVKVVEADDLVAAAEELLRSVKADEAGGARHQYLQRILPSLISRRGALVRRAALSPESSGSSRGEGSVFRRAPATAARTVAGAPRRPRLCRISG